MSATIIGIVLGAIAAIAAFGAPWEVWIGLLHGRIPALAEVAPAVPLVRISSDIVQAYAILAGLVVQVITLVTMVFNPGRMDSSRVSRITLELEKMQLQLLGLFGVYAVTLVLALATKVLAGPGDTPNFSSLAGPLCLAGTSFMVVFSLARTGVMGISIMSVQRLRTRLLIEQAKDEESKTGEMDIRHRNHDAEAIEPDPTPSAYGSKGEGKP